MSISIKFNCKINLKNLLLIFFIFPIFLSSCKEENLPVEPDYRYGPGAVIFKPFIRADINGIMMPADYGYSNFAFYSNKYDTRDSSLYITRWMNTSSRDQYINIEGFKMDLNHMNYPMTFWPSSLSTRNYSKLEFSLNRNKYYEVSSIDSTLFSITLTGYNNKELSGNFQGLLINSLDSDTVSITNGLFNVILDLW